MHFLNKTKWKEDEATTALWYLLEGCRHFGWLTPQHLTEGFEDYQLKAILDLQIANYRLSYRTHFLAEVFEATSAGSYRELIKKIVDNRGSIIVQNRSGGHWVLVTSDKKDAVVLDSGSYENPLSPLGNRRLSEDGQGIVVLPYKREKIEIAW